METRGWGVVGLGALVASLGCGTPEAPDIARFTVATDEVEAGAGLAVTWLVEGADRVELVANGRVIRNEPARNGIEAVVSVRLERSTTLELVARGTERDAVERRDVRVTPWASAQPVVRGRAAGETRFELQFDSLGADDWAVEIDGVPAPDFTPTARGRYAGTARRAETGFVPVRFVARTAEATSEVTLDVLVYGGEVEPNDAPEQARPLTPPRAGVAAGVIGAGGAGDVDLFAFEVADGEHVQAVLRTPDGGCAERGRLRLLDPDGEERSRVVGARGCPTLSADRPGNQDLAAGRYFIEVTDAPDAAYWLTVEARPAACGNDILEVRAGEHCERANPSCPSDCRVSVLEEVEPNDSMPTQILTLETPVEGRVDRSDVFDVDVYTFDLASAAHVTFEVTGPGLAGCAFPLGELRLETAAGVRLATAPIDQAGRYCGRIDGGARTELEAGRYRVAVRLAQLDGPAEPRYFLRARVGEAYRCGNAVREPGEACDDGNVEDGDGCDATCALEPSAVLAPSLARVDLELGPLEEGDARLLHLLTPNGPTRLWLEARGDGAASGTQEVMQAWLDGRLVASGTARDGLSVVVGVFGEPSPHVLELRPRAGAGFGRFTATVLYTDQDGGCGDGAVQYTSGEACDDANGANDDGCTDACRLSSVPANAVAAPARVSVPEVQDRFRTGVIRLEGAARDARLVVTPQPGPLDFCPEAFSMALFDTEQRYTGARQANRQGACRALATRIDTEGDLLLAVRQEARGPLGPLELLVEVEPPTCGDGVWTSGLGEACDDGNRTLNDGCDDACALEAGVQAEVEPNDSPATAELVLTRTSSGTDIQSVVVAVHRRGEDPADVFAIDNASGAPVWLEAYVDDEGECSGNVSLTLRDASEATVADALVGMLVRCRELSPPTSPAVAALPPGRYTLALASRSGGQRTRYLRLRVGSGDFR